MGRLIPAGTGMRFYRNIEVAHDPTVNQKQERDYEDIPIITGGIDLPDSSLDVPLVEADMEGFSIEDENGEVFLEETEETVFDADTTLDEYIDDGDI